LGSLPEPGKTLQVLF